MAKRESIQLGIQDYFSKPMKQSMSSEEESPPGAPPVASVVSQVIPRMIVAPGHSKADEELSQPIRKDAVIGDRTMEESSITDSFPKQPFPVKSYRISSDGRNHNFLQRWYKDYPWLHFLSGEFGVKCFTCARALDAGMLTSAIR